MTKNKLRTFLMLAAALLLSGALKAQEAVPASGGEASGSGGSSSYTLGQVVYKTQEGTAGSITQGVQQSIELFTLSNPELTAIELKAGTYPNPTTDFINLVISTDKLEGLSYAMFDLQGRCISEFLLTTRNTQISMRGLAAGTYILKVRQDKSELKTFKIIKN